MDLCIMGSQNHIDEICSNLAVPKTVTCQQLHHGVLFTCFLLRIRSVEIIYLQNFLLKYFILYLFLFRFFTYTGRWKVTSFHNIFSGNTNLHERNLPSYLGSTYLSLSIPPEGVISRFFCFQGVQKKARHEMG